MIVYDGLSAIDSPIDRSVLTVGNFDGVHLAHQSLIGEARRRATTEIPAVVLTFEPHPLTVVAPQRAPVPLMPLHERLRLLGEAGADIVVVARSEPLLLTMEAEEFVREVVWERFHPVHVVEGPTFGFGRGRKGGPELLMRLAPDYGFSVEIVLPVSVAVGGKPVQVSSSTIRDMLGQGDVESAKLLLGRPYRLFGKVAHGDGRGRTIGFPTANLEDVVQLIPGDGVYAGRAFVDDSAFDCAISIGRRATFGGGARLVEAHLLDFNGNLYGRDLRLDFLSRLRDQKRFDSVGAIAAQLQVDVAATRQLMSTIQQRGRTGPPSADLNSESPRSLRALASI